MLFKRGVVKLRNVLQNLPQSRHHRAIRILPVCMLERSTWQDRTMRGNYVVIVSISLTSATADLDIGPSTYRKGTTWRKRYYS